MNNTELFLYKKNQSSLPNIINTKLILNEIESKAIYPLGEKINSQTQKNIESRIHQVLCSLNERLLIKELGKYSSFSEYREELLSSDWQIIFDEYPVANRLYLQQEKGIVRLISSIIKSFSSDKKNLQKLSICSPTDYIKDIEWGHGDVHNGMSTTMVTLSGNKKLIYKPTDGAITKAYHQFLDWINKHFSLGLGRYKSLNKNEYHWQEFVENKECQFKEDSSSYYERAGWLLGIVYLLNGRDFHYENLIANGENPILIDHETIIQPKLSSKFCIPDIDLKTEDTVHDSFLLPNDGEHAKFFPKGMCGFGFHKEIKMSSIQRKAINEFSNDWKMVVRIVKQEMFKHNIPSHNDSKLFLNEYLDAFLFGFESSYKFFMNKKELLLSKKSPLKVFENLQVRYIWRPTNVYVKILEYMRLPKNLIDQVAYNEKIKDYLKIAYKRIGNKDQVELVLKDEISQMLRGDVPYFSINANSRNLHTEHGVIKGFFEYSCVENVERKLKKLSLSDLELQKSLIKKSVLE